ncbi:YDG/SRA domain-containing protein [Vibrio astriarenae]
MRTFGHILGVEVGDIFESRATLAKVGIHPPTQAGISGGAKEGANSIVLSGGYEDDEDFGDEIIYTGAGGRDENSGKQIADQRLERTNMALAKNSLEGLPVRVTRSHKHRAIIHHLKASNMPVYIESSIIGVKMDYLDTKYGGID